MTANDKCKLTIAFMKSQYDKLEEVNLRATDLARHMNISDEQLSMWRTGKRQIRPSNRSRVELSTADLIKKKKKGRS